MPLLRSLYFRDLPICLAWKDDLLDRHGSEWICIQSALKRDEVRKWNVWTDWPSTSSGAALARASILNCTVLCTATYALPLTRNQRNGIHVRCAEALANPPQLEKDSRKGRYPRSRSWALSLSVPEAETSGSVSNGRPPFRQVASPRNPHDGVLWGGNVALLRPESVSQNGYYSRTPWQERELSAKMSFCPRTKSMSQRYRIHRLKGHGQYNVVGYEYRSTCGYGCDTNEKACSNAIAGALIYRKAAWD
jgi:hypothetical protein